MLFHGCILLSCHCGLFALLDDFLLSTFLPGRSAGRTIRLKFWKFIAQIIAQLICKLVIWVLIVSNAWFRPAQLLINCFEAVGVGHLALPLCIVPPGKLFDPFFVSLHTFKSCTAQLRWASCFLDMIAHFAWGLGKPSLLQYS